MVVYKPGAVASKAPSISMYEEQKRKIRISAGGLQSVWMLKPLLNIFKYGKLSFQYISHRVLRWVVCPILLLPIFFINLLLAVKTGEKYLLFYFFSGCIFFDGYSGMEVSLKGFKDKIIVCALLFFIYERCFAYWILKLLY